MKDILGLLHHHFGYIDFRHNQQAIIEHILEGKDTVALMPTGGGKSLCYQIPALALEGVTVVVSPLIALMKDQVVALRQYGIPAAYLNSSLSGGEQKRIIDQLRAGALKLLYVAPERLVGEASALSLLEGVRVALLPSTRPTVSAVGATTSVRNTGYLGSSRPAFRMFPSWPSPPRPTPGQNRI